MIFWKRRSSAASASNEVRYSSSVVAPMACTSPRARAGLRMLAVSRPPWVDPAPTMVCISSMKMIVSLALRSASMSRCMRSSNSPRNFVPATSAETSSEKMRLPASVAGTSPAAMRSASPSTTALLPTPASPTRIGLFFLRRERICTRRSISLSRPTTGSICPWRACCVRSVPNFSSCEGSDAARKRSSSSGRSGAASCSSSRERPRSGSSGRGSLRCSSAARRRAGASSEAGTTPYISIIREVSVPRSATMACSAWIVETLHTPLHAPRSSSSKVRYSASGRRSRRWGRIWAASSSRSRRRRTWAISQSFRRVASSW